MINENLPIVNQMASCPFCGGSPKPCAIADPADIHVCHMIVCENCGQFDFGSKADPNNQIESSTDLLVACIRIWNKRVQDNKQE